jgi:hypothetical protein
MQARIAAPSKRPGSGRKLFVSPKKTRGPGVAGGPAEVVQARTAAPSK